VDVDRAPRRPASALVAALGGWLVVGRYQILGHSVAVPYAVPRL